jgi:hypothetical protein
MRNVASLLVLFATNVAQNRLGMEELRTGPIFQFSFDVTPALISAQNF